MTHISIPYPEFNNEVQHGGKKMITSVIFFRKSGHNEEMVAV